MQETAGEALLTDLCTICHINPIKYTCPRCGVHTCSLPCVKRHKTWAQCSGVRDPAAYRKRAELNTPASVDQDFNFITSVERSLQRAEDRALDRGIGLNPSGIGRHGHDPKRRFDLAVEESGVHLIRAPRGLSRSKQNKSHWAGGGKCIMWTTEWLRYDGQQRYQNVLESRTVGEALLNAFGSKRPILRKKRKRSNPETAEVPTASAQQPTTDGDPQLQQQNHDSHLPIPEDPVDAHAPTPGDQQLSRDQSLNDKTCDATETGPLEPQVSQTLDDIHVYLLRPNTASKAKCLIPVACDSTLSDVLRNRTILEFPTFYVRTESPDALPEPFVTEEKYDQAQGIECPIDLPAYAPSSQLGPEEQTPLDDVDASKVLEVLHRDLSG